MKTNKEYLKIFQDERNISDATIRLYTNSCKWFVKTIGLELEHVIKMPISELRKILINYRSKLYKDENLAVSSRKKYWESFLSILRHFDVLIPYLPKISLREDNHIFFKDIPTMSHVKQVVEYVEKNESPEFLSLVLFQASSGTARMECFDLKIRDFFSGFDIVCEDNKEAISLSLKELLRGDLLVPLICFVRRKTNYPYYILCSDEASRRICSHLLMRHDLNLDDCLFSMSFNTMNSFYKRVNRVLNFPVVGKQLFFRSHSLRKMNACIIKDVEFVNAIHGRKRSPVIEAYFKTDPTHIRNKYIEKYMSLLQVSPIKIINNDYLGTISNMQLKDLLVLKKEIDIKVNELLNEE
ncbi:MAG: hypothetical protein LBC39_02735 [Methanobrevibacter sp.]|jgi:hypothetical protein|nr:hypothetical protein [Candidatus Methanovirga aequatorialis]